MPTAALKPNHYLAAVRAYPQLERDHELELARLWRDRRDAVEDELSVAEIGRQLGVSRERARQL